MDFRLAVKDRIFLLREILMYFQSLGSCTNLNHSLTALCMPGHSGV